MSEEEKEMLERCAHIARALSEVTDNILAACVMGQVEGGTMQDAVGIQKELAGATRDALNAAAALHTMVRHPQVRRELAKAVQS